jgi:hypothetical protein
MLAWGYSKPRLWRGCIFTMTIETLRRLNGAEQYEVSQNVAAPSRFDWNARV